MQVTDTRCGGSAGHTKTVAACGIVSAADGQIRKAPRTFETRPGDGQARAGWLRAEGVTPVAMESTGVSWKPVYPLLEGELEVGG